MSVYLNSGMVLLNGGMVATDAGCCCGCACPPAHPCAVSFTWTLNDPCTETTIGGSVSNKVIDTNCDVVDSDGFRTSCWAFAPLFPSCSVAFDHFLDYIGEPGCKQIHIDLIHYCGSWCEANPTGWYLIVSVLGDDLFGCCQFYNYNPLDPCVTGVYLGADDSIFNSDLPFSTNLDAGGALPSYGTVSGTFLAACE